MTEFVSRNHGHSCFEIIIKTTNEEHYKWSEEFARQLVDHEKPMAVAALRAQQEPLTDGTQKCSFGDGVTIKPDGVHELDPCIYEEIERYRNVTVIVSRCKKCGNVDISWMRQENTEDVNYSD